MNKIDRNKVEKPECLKQKSVAWTKEYIEKRKSKPNYWNWHEYNKEKVAIILTEKLSLLTKYHCSYCGFYPLKENLGSRSIDHFKPKSKFPDLAFDWENLFISCSDCQKNKASAFPDCGAIKPDEPDYNFDYWFEIDWSIQKNYIIPNKDRTRTEQEIAQNTIDWLGLNKGERPQARFEELEKYKSNSIKDLWQWSYPYFLERGEN